MSFGETLKFGKVAESEIAQWLRRSGWSILPVYEKVIDEGKGPQLYTAHMELIAPDLLAFRENNVIWAEVKHKTAFSWHRLTRRWTTGIDRRHYHEYLRVEKESPWPVYLFFLHLGGQAKDSPPDSPSGLFGERLSVLKDNVNHESPNWGSSGMVYWALEALEKYVELDDLRRGARGFDPRVSSVAYQQKGNQLSLPF